MSNKNEEKETYSMKELADILGITDTTAYRYCQQKQLPVKKILGKWIIPKKAIDRYLKGEYFEDIV